jgi:hypothetical protein
MMPTDKEIEAEVRRLLALDPAALESELLAVAGADEAFLESLPLQVTVPPEPLKTVFASLNPKQRLDAIRRGIEEQLDKRREDLRQLVCVKLKYCDRRGESELNLVVAILSGILGHSVLILVFPKAWLIPIVIVYLFRNGYFDRLCECPKKK